MFFKKEGENRRCCLKYIVLLSTIYALMNWPLKVAGDYTLYKTIQENSEENINLVLEFNSNATITCAGEERIMWMVLSNNNHFETRSYIDTDKNTKFPYKSELILKNVNEKHIDVYMCTNSITQRHHLNKVFLYYMSSVSVYITAKKGSTPPKITPALPFVELNKNENISICCEADEPIIWMTDQIYLDEKLKAQFWSEVCQANSNSKCQNSTQPYCLTLSLTNVTAVHTLSYYCLKKNQILSIYENANERFLLDRWVREKIAAKIHVFVNDTSRETSEYYKIYPFPDVIISCRPNSFNGSVRLVTRNGLVLCSSDKPTEYSTSFPKNFFEFVNYDPTMGFRLGRVLQVEEEIFCEHSSNRSKNWQIKFRSSPTLHGLPYIYSTSYHFATVGEDIVLECVCVECGELMGMTWLHPTGVHESCFQLISNLFKKNSNQQQRMTETKPYVIAEKSKMSTLNMRNIQISDSGFYTCIAMVNYTETRIDEYEIKVYDKNETFFYLDEFYHRNFVTINSDQIVEIRFKYRIYPKPSFKWLMPNQSEIFPTTKYKIEDDGNFVSLKMSDKQIEDNGDYTLIATAGKISKFYKFKLHIPIIKAVTVEDVFIKSGDAAKFICRIVSYPAPQNVSWEFRLCIENQSDLPSAQCAEKRNYDYTTLISNHSEENQFLYEFAFKPTQPGTIVCIANHEAKNLSSKAHLGFLDLKDNVIVLGFANEIIRDKQVVFTCAVSIYYFSDEISWWKEGTKVVENSGIRISNERVAATFKACLSFESIQLADSGEYECRVFNTFDNKTLNKYFSVKVQEPKAPIWTLTNLNNTELEVKFGERLELVCKSDAKPKANVSWYKNGRIINESERVKFVEGNTKLLLPLVKAEDEGIYECLAQNGIGSVARAKSKINVTNPQSHTAGIIGGALVCLMLLGLLILGVRYKKRINQLKELEAAGLTKFEEGNEELINRNISIYTQAHLLPYDRKNEFPAHKLRRIKALGAGNFGVVYKAEAEGILANEEKTIVAVKMVNEKADNETILALVSELKILNYLGNHPNIVNLLGAVTKNILKRDLMVIVEFCPHGSLESFLRNNKGFFVDQMDADGQIMLQNFESDENHELKNEAQIYSENQVIEENATETSEESPYTKMNELSEQDFLLQEDTSISYTRSRFFSTSDLINWSIQLARGMDYLVSKNIIHGDLAARNVLLCDDNVVKICDFGLARNLYNRAYHRKRPEAYLPAKWIALESLTHDIYTKYSDVWSYGVLLWEIFSLCEIPYAHMQLDELTRKLGKGTRLEKPAYANDDLYLIMRKCWHSVPESRPMFDLLEKALKFLLGHHSPNFDFADFQATKDFSDKNESANSFDITPTPVNAVESASSNLTECAKTYNNLPIGSVAPNNHLKTKNESLLSSTASEASIKLKHITTESDQGSEGKVADKKGNTPQEQPNLESLSTTDNSNQDVQEYLVLNLEESSSAHDVIVPLLGSETEKSTDSKFYESTTELSSFGQNCTTPASIEDPEHLDMSTNLLENAKNRIGGNEKDEINETCEYPYICL